MEIVRRILLVVGVGAALWIAIVPVGALVAIQHQDFARDQARRPAWSGDRELTLDAFVEQRTEGRVAVVSGNTWQAVADAAAALERGDGVPEGAPGPIGERYGSKAFYVAPDAPLLGEVGARLGEAEPFLYVRIDAATGPRWLTVGWRPGSEGDVEPSSIYHPHRHLWLWILLATIALYVLLPRPKRGPDTLRSHPRAAVVLPDFLGVLLFALFFGLSLLLASQMATTGFPLAGDWLVPTLILWGFALAGLSILAISTHYAVLRFRLLPDRVERISLGGTDSRAYDDIESVESATKEPPKAIGCLGLLAGLLSWRALGPTLMAGSRSTSILDVRFRGGDAWRISINALEDPKRLEEALRRG